ncbi:hypothetical protein N7540_009069 [Penicillium herquei]|nr:hypothetical protein N7540_009069 [Penicillium herquei]
MLFFGLGKLVYVIILFINAIAILSEDRFLARIGWGRTQAEPGFGSSHDSTSVKAKSINLIASVRTSRLLELEAYLNFGASQGLARVKYRRRQQRDTKQTDKANQRPKIPVPLIVINTVIIVYELILG